MVGYRPAREPTYARVLRGSKSGDEHGHHARPASPVLSRLPWRRGAEQAPDRRDDAAPWPEPDGVNLLARLDPASAEDGVPAVPFDVVPGATAQEAPSFAPAAPDAPSSAPWLERHAPATDSPEPNGDRPKRGPDGRFLRRSTGTSAAQPAAAPPPTPAPMAPVAPTRTSEPVVAADPAPERRVVVDELAAARPIRVLLVEDVPDVANHVRELLRYQSRFKLVHVCGDGREVPEALEDHEPDVVIVDSLLQGRADAKRVVDRLRHDGQLFGIVALTVPDHPLDAAIERHADAVVAMPFGTIDLARGITDAHTAAAERDPSATSRIVAVFSPKGGVGTTTLAYNLAACLAATRLRTLLIDGSLQFGGVRHMLRADAAAPSICDLPTDRVRATDLADTVIPDRSGIDVLLAPPRPELAELVNGRDLDQLLGSLRRAYQAIVVDLPSNLSEPTLAFLDAADVVVDVLTADPPALDITRLIGGTFAELGYTERKVRYLVNRHDEADAVPASRVSQALGREPDFAVASDWHLVSLSNAEGIPFVLARPDARVSVDVRRVAEAVRAVHVAPAAHEARVGFRRR